LTGHERQLPGWPAGVDGLPAGTHSRGVAGRAACDVPASGCLSPAVPAMSTVAFHPAVARWFDAAFPGPTEAQVAAWPAIMAGRSTLVAAPTGSGKTLTAFLAAIDEIGRAH